MNILPRVRYVCPSEWTHTDVGLSTAVHPSFGYPWLPPHIFSLSWDPIPSRLHLPAAQGSGDPVGEGGACGRSHGLETMRLPRDACCPQACGRQTRESPQQSSRSFWTGLWYAALRCPMQWGKLRQHWWKPYAFHTCQVSCQNHGLNRHFR